MEDSPLVIAISASALFDTSEGDKIFQEKGVENYRFYQQEHKTDILPRGVAYPFIERILSLNSALGEQDLIKVVLFSRNSPEAGLRVMNSIRAYSLNISTALFTSGEYNFQYLTSVGASLFLSANRDHVKTAIDAGFAAGVVLPTIIPDSDAEPELRLAFDFDGVIADDDSEIFYNSTQDLAKYHKHEAELAGSPLSRGPIGEFLQKISRIQQLERSKKAKDSNYQQIIKTAIVTARNAPAHERVITTLNDLGITVDSAFFIGGMKKSLFLNVMKPHMFFDDQMKNLADLKHVPAVHIPFGIKNIDCDMSIEQSNESI